MIGAYICIHVTKDRATKEGDHLPTPMNIHITSINAEVRKFQALERYITQISLT